MYHEYPLLEAQQEIHDLAAAGAPLTKTLAAVAEWAERMLPQALVSIMRFDPANNTLSLVANRHFSPAYTAHMQALMIGPAVGTCGRAAFEKQLVVTEDIDLEPHWTAFKDVALAEGLRACWSVPILSTQGELLGTFATYYRHPASPTQEEQNHLAHSASLAALVLLRHRDKQQHRMQSEWHRSLFVNHPDGVYEFNLEGHFQRCNTALERITGYDASELIGLHFSQFIAPNFRESTQQAFNTACRGEAITYETLGSHANGHYYSLEITNFPVIIDDIIVGVYGICRDVTTRNKQTDELRLLKRGMEASPSGIIMVDAQQNGMPIVFANPAFYRITGYTPDEVIGNNSRFLRGPDTGPEATEAIRDAMREKRDISITLLHYRKNGQPFWNHLVVSPVFDPGGNCTHYIGIHQDITHEKKQEAKLAYQATHDLLTDLPNYSAFTEQLSTVFEQHQRGNHGTLAVLHLNLDGFKAINDGLGHLVANQVLVTVARRLEGMISHPDMLARLVGDEFAILLAVKKGHTAAIVSLAERILTTLAEPVALEGELIHISASIGIACHTPSIQEPYSLLQHADLALEQAKRQGRNTWQWYRGRKAENVKYNVAMRHELHTALSAGDFVLHYQPIVDAVSGRIRSVEALVRWQHPSLGLVSPGEFIPLAEQTGQIIPLGRWVLLQACRDIAALNAQSERILPVAVNISSLQFCREGFLDEVKHALDISGLQGEQLELEVTESVLLDGTGPIIALMETLTSMGVRIALDDFGTGFSSLSYLCDLPTHKVKLDRRFVQEAQKNRRMAAIVQGVITMAHHMDMIVVAEGIETAEQQQDLSRRHCDLLQGYLFARPMPLHELQQLPDLLMSAPLHLS
ncbi:MAG: EAL domain-containing protein [Halomonas sp.]|nr:EAL domain-containing protein [Halomonas sp.]MDP3536114.1 EAL domain-containing protein [Halomonas sp.]